MRILPVSILLLLLSAANAGTAPADTGCSAQTRAALTIAKTAPEACLVTARLVPGRTVILAAWITDPDSPPQIPLAAVLDARALAAGRKVYLYRRQAQGEDIGAFRFNGKAVELAVDDFDKSGRPGWAMHVIPDTDYTFEVTVYDPRSKKFIEAGGQTNDMSFTADDLDALVDVQPGRILVPSCEAVGASGGKLYYDVWLLQHGHFEKTTRIPATTAPASERTKCARSGPE